MKDYYSILGLDKNASAQDIKKAYRKLAIQYHPDKTGGDPESDQKFRDISEAYDTLSDPEKKQKYDNPVTGWGPFNGMEDMFNFNFGDIFQGRKTNKNVKGPSLMIMVNLTLEEMATGSIKQIEIRKRARCGKCNGEGAEPGGAQTCNHCLGVGHKRKVVNSGFGQISMDETCTHCGGQGKIITDSCISCYGNGFVTVNEKLEVRIPAGFIPGMNFILTGKGEWVKGCNIPGDVTVKIEEYVHPVFIRENFDLICNKKISFTKACLGGELEIPNLTGGFFKFKIPELTSPGKMFRISGKGIPYHNSSKTGDVIVKISLEMPKEINEVQRQKLLELEEIL